LSAEIVADLGFAELTSATGYSRYRDHGQRDQTDLLITLQYFYEEFPTFSAFTREDEVEKTFTQELRLVSRSESKLNWIAGLFLLDFEQPEGVSREFTPEFDAYLGGSRPDSLEYINVVLEDLTERALYGEIGYAVTDRLELSFGARYYDYSYEARTATDFPLLNTVFGGAPPDAIDLTFNDPALQDESGSLFKFNAAYRFNDDVMGYFTISEGYRIGASNGISLCTTTGGPQNVCTQPEEFEYVPDTTQNYEIGLRSQWLDNRLTLNGALYYIDWQDPQLTSATAVGAQPITINGEGAESTGLEVSIDARPTDRLSIGLSYAHTKAELTEVAPRLIRDLTTPVFGTDPVQYIDGQPGDRLPGSPEDQATVYFGYDWTLSSSWDLTFNYGVSAVGDIITTAGERGGGETLGGFSLHHASAVFRGGPWQFTVYAQNLLDKYAVTGVRSRRAFIQTEVDENGDPVRVRSFAQQMVRPREIGFRFTYDLEPSGRRGN
jgi:outer membrane receptor protein involved in Fe transport